MKPILFAINYSPQAADLLATGRLQIDRFKCPDWPDMIAKASRQHPVAVHTNLTAGRGRLRVKNFDAIAQLLDQTDTPYINVHLETRLDDLDGVPIDTTDPVHLEQVVSLMIEDLQILSRRFGAEKVIAENVPYRPSGHVLRPSVEPQVIRRVIEQSGCGLLLDIAHACISAHHIGLDDTVYMAQLPIQRLREMHFCGVQNLNGRLQDHLPATQADWQMLDWVLEHIRQGDWPTPWLLAFEYGGVGEKFAARSELQVIQEQGTKLYQMLKG
jgi:uncharacterized protein (UPF0276 family)